MSPPGVPGEAGAEPRPTLPADLPVAVAAAWARAVIGTSYVPMTPREIEALLRDLVRQLHMMADAEPFTARSGRPVGARLVDAHFTNPRSLSRTIAVLLTEGAPSAEPAHTARWPLLVAAVADGYAARLVDRVRREQQEIIDAALTAREQAERDLRASEERLERAREDFLTTMSHELKTPLTPIKGYLHTLISAGDAIDPSRRADYYRVMLRQAEQLDDLVEDLLAAAALQQDRFRVVLERVEIADVIERALDDVSPVSARRFSWQRGDGAIEAWCDPRRLRQVVTTLLSNADKYSPPAKPVQVSARLDRDWAEIVVRDCGPGIPSDEIEAVFEPFRRIGHSSTRGAGLGLHLARRLMESMNGRIWVDDDEQQGASFHVVVPRVVVA